MKRQTWGRWCLVLLSLAMLCFLPLVRRAWAKGEYRSAYLYTKTRDADTGGLELTLAPSAPRIVVAVAVQSRGKGVYLGTVQGKTILFSHLPVDKYGLLLVGEKDFYEGFRLLRHGSSEWTKQNRAAIEKEIKGIEAFFDGKRIERLLVNTEAKAMVLLQQWRQKKALAESGERLKGMVHSIDLVEFEKPVKAWQLVKRRQLYRDETPWKQPLKAHFVAALGGIRVVGSMKKLGRIRLTDKMAKK